MPESSTLVSQEASRQLASIRENVEKVIVGKPEVVSLALVALLARGHLLIEDVPGVGKTTLARALARSFGAEFQRIQFTSDLLPSDILGVSVYNKQKEAFDFHPGPIFASFILADEINRTTPKTQSSLLEAMNTGRVSIDRQTYTLPQPFLVLATENPLEFHGTYPLPNSQMDRFLMRIRMGYPGKEAEKEILRRGLNPLSVEELDPVLGADEIIQLQAAVEQVEIEESLLDYMTQLAAATREHPRMELGVSPRGTLALQQAAKARALLEGRAYVTPDDIKEMTVPVLAHRILPTGEGEAFSHKGDGCEQLVREIADTVEVPL
jgi:MoxR-like ATPase